jgi:UDP-2-acetamido-2-deoxy-ribo-hexuluronate aminotransferase
VNSIPFVDLEAQYLSQKEKIDARINAVLQHGQFIMGPEVGELEYQLQEFSGAKYCIAVASGTEALLISLMALEIKPGDEVITTPFTFVSTAEVIALLGATPVFVDIEPDTANINASLIQEKITNRTKAIIPVSLYGQPSDMDEINSIAARNGDIPVIEDAAQSFGASLGNKRSCNLSTVGCTSFFPSKPLGCYGDGGAIFTNDDSLNQVCRQLRVHGQEARYSHTRVGVGGRMDTMQCAVVLAKFERFNWELERRSVLGNKYNNLIDEVGVSRIQQREGRTSVFGQYTILVNNRECLQAKLKKEGIPTAVHYPVPLNEQPAYRSLCKAGSTPVAKDLSQKVLSLPMSPYLSEDSVHKIVDSLV